MQDLFKLLPQLTITVLALVSSILIGLSIYGRTLQDQIDMDILERGQRILSYAKTIYIGYPYRETVLIDTEKLEESILLRKPHVGSLGLLDAISQKVYSHGKEMHDFIRAKYSRKHLVVSIIQGYMLRLNIREDYLADSGSFKPGRKINQAMRETNLFPFGDQMIDRWVTNFLHVKESINGILHPWGLKRINDLDAEDVKSFYSRPIKFGIPNQDKELADFLNFDSYFESVRDTINNKIYPEVLIVQKLLQTKGELELKTILLKYKSLGIPLLLFTIVGFLLPLFLSSFYEQSSDKWTTALYTSIFCILALFILIMPHLISMARGPIDTTTIHGMLADALKLTSINEHSPANTTSINDIIADLTHADLDADTYDTLLEVQRSTAEYNLFLHGLAVLTLEAFDNCRCATPATIDFSDPEKRSTPADIGYRISLSDILPPRRLDWIERKLLSERPAKVLVFDGRVYDMDYHNVMNVSSLIGLIRGVIKPRVESPKYKLLYERLQLSVKSASQAINED